MRKRLRNWLRRGKRRLLLRKRLVLNGLRAMLWRTARSWNTFRVMRRKRQVSTAVIVAKHSVSKHHWSAVVTNRVELDHLLEQCPVKVRSCLTALVKWLAGPVLNDSTWRGLSKNHHLRPTKHLPYQPLDSTCQQCWWLDHFPWPHRCHLPCWQAHWHPVGHALTHHCHRRTASNFSRARKVNPQYAVCWCSIIELHYNIYLSRPLAQSTCRFPAASPCTTANHWSPSKGHSAQSNAKPQIARSCFKVIYILF